MSLNKTAIIVYDILKYFLFLFILIIYDRQTHWCKFSPGQLWQITILLSKIAKAYKMNKI